MEPSQKRYVYWCETCGVPLLQAQCGICGGSGTKMCADLKPVFDQEKSYLEGQLEEKLPEPKELLWSFRNILWHGGRPYAKLSWDAAPQISRRFSHPLATWPKDPPTPNAMLQANHEALEALEQEATAFIRETVGKYEGLEPVVSFSGGKDSTVVSHLVRKALGRDDIAHVFGDTSIEFPDTYTFVREFQSAQQNIPFYVETSGLDWFDMCDSLQPPSRFTAWCCSVFKSVPIAKALERLGNGRTVLCFEGVRRSESTRRRMRPRVASRNKIASQVLARPILHWKDVHVWVYTLAYNLPVNSAYLKGIPRVGCLYCPYHGASLDSKLGHFYPDEVKRWREYVTDFAWSERKVDPETYWRLGGWKLRVGHRQGETSPSRVAHTSCSDNDGTLNFILQRGFDAQALAQFLTPFGKVEHSNGAHDQMLRVSKNGSLLFVISGVEGLPRLKLIPMGANADRSLISRLKNQLRKFQACAFCNVCRVVCRAGAISVQRVPPEYKIDASLCNQCGECLNGKRIKGGCIAVNASYGSDRPDQRV